MPSGTHYIQFPDLTEIYASTYIGSKHSTYGGYEERKQFEIMGNFATEFVFGTILSSESRQWRKNLIGYGFQHVSSMINWSPFHLDCRALELWWFRNPNPTPPNPNPRPRYWDSGYRGWLSKNCQASGCGLKLHDRYLAHRSVWRFHTLMRMPIEPNAKQLWWLRRFHFRRIDTGCLASYWTNGFSPVNYSTALELRWWRRHGIHTDASKPIFKKADSSQCKDRHVPVKERCNNYHR